MLDFDFDRLEYTRYRDFASEFYISELIGFDSETYENGHPFLFCSAVGHESSPKHLLPMLLGDSERRMDFATWNLRFDSGSIISLLPLELKIELAVQKKVRCDGVTWEYIPHKMLRLKWKGKTRNFWDIMPFFRSSLDTAAWKYLGKKKLSLPTKTFTPDYVRKHYPQIVRYCFRDAELTGELGNYLLRYLRRFKIKPRSLYSTASVSFTYFRQTCPYMHVWNFWKLHRPLLRYATESYYGGKFEITARGPFAGHEYDISSAYGYEIANLLDLSYAKVTRSVKYQDRADYGFLRVVIHNKDMRPIPVTYKRNDLNIYPAGKFATTITKQEYDYLVRAGIPVRLVSGWWITFNERYHPYRAEVLKLYKVKEDFKHKDEMISRLAKTMVNSLYGKFVQVNEKPDGRLLAGVGWNPIYSAIITANIRIRVTELQEQLGKDCLAVHTDSILTTRKMPEDFTSGGLGGWELKKSGKGVIIACGLYQIGDKSANRGYLLPKKHAWTRMLKKAGSAQHIDIRELRVNSWTSRVSVGRDDGINVFERYKKRMDLNCERKRLWPGTTNAARLLDRLEYSQPIPVLDF